MFIKRSGLVRGSLKEAIRLYPEILINSHYSSHLPKYIRRFGDSLLILRFDDLVQSPTSFIQIVYDFLDIPFEPSIDYQRKVLPAGEARSYRAARLARQTAQLVRKIGRPDIVGKVKETGVVQRLLYRPFGPGDRPRMTEEESLFLTNWHRKGIAELADLTGQDYSGWVG
jgi:hypothetical protein